MSKVASKHPEVMGEHHLRRWIGSSHRLRVYAMNASVLNKLRSNGREIVCLRCGESVRIGDEVVSKAGRRTKYYHLECFRELL